MPKWDASTTGEGIEILLTSVPGPAHPWTACNISLTGGFSVTQSSCTNIHRTNSSECCHICLYLGGCGRVRFDYTGERHDFRAPRCACPDLPVCWQTMIQRVRARFLGSGCAGCEVVLFQLQTPPVLCCHELYKPLPFNGLIFFFFFLFGITNSSRHRKVETRRGREGCVRSVCFLFLITVAEQHVSSWAVTIHC